MTEADVSKHEFRYHIQEISCEFCLKSKLQRIIGIFCEQTEENQKKYGYIHFKSDDGVRWICTIRDNALCNFKLDHIFTDLNLKKMFSEKLSLLLDEK